MVVCSSQRQLQRAVLSHRSKHSCGFNYILSTTSKEKYILKNGGALLCSSLARTLRNHCENKHIGNAESRLLGGRGREMANNVFTIMLLFLRKYTCIHQC